MTQLLYSAKTSKGKVLEGFVKADTAQQARDTLLAQELNNLPSAYLQRRAKLKIKFISTPKLWSLWRTCSEAMALHLLNKHFSKHFHTYR